MNELIELISQPWPWYVAGPLVGLMVPLLLLLGNKGFGVSPSLRHVCAAVAPGRSAFFRYDWRRAGGWNLALVAGILIGGGLAGFLLTSPEPVAIASSVRADLMELGVRDFGGLVPNDVFAWEALLTVRGALVMALGGFLVGFGAAWAGGCTSGHAVSGLANFQLPSLIAAMAFFAGGVLATRLVLPLLF